MMMGDWAPMPMNRREPEPELPSTGQHYDVIVYDDVLPEPGPVPEPERERAVADMSFNEFMEQSFGKPLTPPQRSWLDHMHELEKRHRAKCGDKLPPADAHLQEYAYQLGQRVLHGTHP